MTVQTDDKYWDCECEHDYINKKSEREHCGWCDTNMHEQPDSIKSEVKKVTESGGEVMTVEITCIECGDKFNQFQGILEERTCLTCILKNEDPEAIVLPPKTKKEREMK